MEIYRGYLGGKGIEIRTSWLVDEEKSHYLQGAEKHPKVVLDFLPLTGYDL